ncbi:uncharacterized protein RHO17_004874 [Thomomys bottae]
MNGKDPTEVGKEELTKSEDNDLTSVVFHSNEDNSNCTSAFEFCSAHDDDSVTERDTSSYTTTKLDETNNNEGDETTLTAIAVCDPTINICLDKNDSTEFGTEDFKQSEDSSLTKVVVHSDEDIKRGDTSTYTTTKLDETNNNEGFCHNLRTNVPYSSWKRRHKSRHFWVPSCRNMVQNL